jgi:hypothetical protein
MKNKYIFTAAAFLLAPVVSVKAVCPVCIVAVSAGLGLSEYLGIDDSIAGVWIGGLLISMSVWTINYCTRKNWLQKQKTWLDPLIFIAYYLMVIWPLYAQDFIGNADNRLFGLDKLVLGIVAGSIIFSLSAWGYEGLKKKNGGKAHFPFEKVVMPVSALILMSLVFYILTK